MKLYYFISECDQHIKKYVGQIPFTVPVVKLYITYIKLLIHYRILIDTKHIKLHENVRLYVFLQL